jgi:Ca2+-binding EF-hand superfamily protein
VPIEAQVELASKLFRKLDQDGNGFLSTNEMSELLHGQRGNWDGDRDGYVSFEEYRGYYQASLKSVSEQVASGELPLKLPNGAIGPELTPSKSEEQRLPEVRAVPVLPELPKWFTEFDIDLDGQVGLYEWKKLGQPSKAFLAMDRNSDGFLEASEVRLFLESQSSTPAGDPRGR